jgi:putative Ig domain-containing protein
MQNAVDDAWSRGAVILAAAGSSASGGKAPHTWSLASGTLTLSPTTGTITGRPTSAGGYSFTVRLTDANNQTALRTFSLSIARAPLSGGERPFARGPA